MISLKLWKNGLRSRVMDDPVGVKSGPNKATVEAEIFGELRKFMISGVLRRVRSGDLNDNAGSKPGAVRKARSGSGVLSLRSSVKNESVGNAVASKFMVLLACVINRSC